MNLQNIFETLRDLNDNDEKARMLKNAWKNSNRVKSYLSFKIMQISIYAPPTLLFQDDFFQNVKFYVMRLLSNKNSTMKLLYANVVFYHIEPISAKN